MGDHDLGESNEDIHSASGIAGALILVATIVVFISFGWSFYNHVMSSSGELLVFIGGFSIVTLLFGWIPWLLGLSFLDRSGWIHEDGLVQTFKNLRTRQMSPVHAIADDVWDLIAPVQAVDYRSYLATDEWQERRTFMLRRFGYRCQICYGASSLEVHHRTYERVGHEQIADLTVLCKDCHSSYHKHRGMLLNS